jgi:hypothetical protein
MRIGTWNVESAAGATKNALRHEMLTASPAAIWVLTETHDDLALAPSHYAVHSGPRSTRPGPDVREGSRWVTIWSSFTVRQRLPVRDPVRTVAALLDTPLGALIVFGTVLPWHSDRGQQPVGKRVPNWSEHYRVIAEQSEEWAQLKRAHPDAAICVAGDLNMNLGGPHWYGTNQGRAIMRSAIENNDLVCATEFSQLPAGRLKQIWALANRRQNKDLVRSSIFSQGDRRFKSGTRTHLYRTILFLRRGRQAHSWDSGL